MKLSCPFVVASRSPRRHRLIEQIGLSFEIQAADIAETVHEAEAPASVVERLAREKAAPIARGRPDALILGADTIVVLEREILGKPADTAEAKMMLGRLSGRTHTVYTGIALLHAASGRSVTAVEATQVTFGTLSDDEIDAYTASGSCLDKAGAYGIQDDRGALFVARIEGDYYTVVGLPLHRFYRVLKSDFADLLAGPA